MQNNSFLYTPNSNIPIGEAVKKKDGTHVLRVKKHKAQQYDEISLESIFQQIILRARPE